MSHCRVIRHASIDRGWYNIPRMRAYCPTYDSGTHTFMVGAGMPTRGEFVRFYMPTRTPQAECMLYRFSGYAGPCCDFYSSWREGTPHVSGIAGTACAVTGRNAPYCEPMQDHHEVGYSAVSYDSFLGFSSVTARQFGQAEIKAVQSN